MPSLVQFPELYRFFQNLEENQEWTPTRLFLACDELVPLKRFYAFWSGRRAPLGWEKGLIEQRLGKPIPWRACRPPVKKENENMRVNQPTLWDRRRERVAP